MFASAIRRAVGKRRIGGGPLLRGDRVSEASISKVNRLPVVLQSVPPLLIFELRSDIALASCLGA